MKKIALILTVVVLNTLGAEAQHRDRRPRNRRVSHTERFEARADRMTEAMATAYDLSDDQKVQIQELNSQWIKNSAYGFNQNFRRNDKQQRPRNCYVDGAECLATPTIYRELRLKESQEQVDAYRKELKEILTKKQFNLYEKKLEEQIAKFKAEPIK